MIPLRQRVFVGGAGEPFVVKLSPSDSDTPALDAIAKLREMSGPDAIFDSAHGELRIEGFDPEAGMGDVLLILPRQNLAHRLIRAKSPHNTLLITERCDQLCVMCSQPPKQYHVDMFDHLTKAALLAPDGATLGISGGEPLLYKDRLFEMMMRVATARPDVSFHLLTNAQHIGEEDAHTLRALPADRLLWGIPLYSPMASHHDDLVGKPGAFEKLLASFAVLGRAGAAIELRTVVMKANIAVLPLLSTLITRKLPFIATWAIMQLENIGYGRMNWEKLFLDTSKDFSLVARAIDIARGRGIAATLYNFPLCTVPTGYRQFAPSTISDWKRKYLSVCDGCRSRSDCGGFFAWYHPQAGFERVGL